MVHLNEILEGLVAACKDIGELPPEITYSTVLLDASGAHSDVSPPLVEFSVEDIDRDRSRNTETVAYEYDNNDNQIGFRFAQWFDAEVTAEVLSVAQTQYNHRELDQKLRKTLLRFDHHTPICEKIPDPENPSEPLEDVSHVVVDGIAPNHDFDMSPTIRTRQLTLDVGFVHEFRTTELGIEYDQIEQIDTPTEWVATTDDGGADIQ